MASLLTESSAIPPLSSEIDRGIGSALPKLSTALTSEPEPASPVNVTVRGDVSRLCPASVLVSAIV